MDDEIVKDFIRTFSEQFIKLAGQVAELRASVNVLKSVLAMQMCPDDPEEGVRQFRILEKKLLDADSSEKQRKEVVDIIDGVKAWRKKGGGGIHEA
jgi:hypothetical protein